MIRICISGLSASGKTSLGHRLARELNLMHITKKSLRSYNDVASGFKGKEKLAQTALPKYAKDFDAELKKLSSKNDCVVTTWLAPWMVKDPTLRIWLNASIDARARRRAKEMNVSVASAIRWVKEKDSLTIRNFKKVYGIDIQDHLGFDMELNTERLNVDEMVAVIAMLALSKSKMKFR